MCIESKSKWSVYSDRHLIHRWIQSSLFAVQVNGSWQNVMPATSMSTVFLVFVPWSLTKYLDLHHFESKLNDIFCHGQGWGIRINSWWVNVCYGQLWIEKNLIITWFTYHKQCNGTRKWSAWFIIEWHHIAQWYIKRKLELEWKEVGWGGRLGKMLQQRSMSRKMIYYVWCKRAWLIIWACMMWPYRISNFIHYTEHTWGP